MKVELTIAILIFLLVGQGSQPTSGKINYNSKSSFQYNDLNAGDTFTWSVESFKIHGENHDTPLVRIPKDFGIVVKGSNITITLKKVFDKDFCCDLTASELDSNILDYLNITIDGNVLNYTSVYLTDTGPGIWIEIPDLLWPTTLFVDNNTRINYIENLFEYYKDMLELIHLNHQLITEGSVITLSFNAVEFKCHNLQCSVLRCALNSFGVEEFKNIIFSLSIDKNSGILQDFNIEYMDLNETYFATHVKLTNTNHKSNQQLASYSFVEPFFALFCITMLILIKHRKKIKKWDY